MKRYPTKSNTEIPVEAPASAGSIDAFDVEDLLSKAKEVIRRDVTNLMIESSKGKLSPTSSKSIIDYVKALNELKEQELSILNELTDEELKKL